MYKIYAMKKNFGRGIKISLILWAYFLIIRLYQLSRNSNFTGMFFGYLKINEYIINSKKKTVITTDIQLNALCIIQNIPKYQSNGTINV